MTDTTRSDTTQVKPMPLWQAVLYFGLPALLFRVSLYRGTPLLLGWGLTPFEATTTAFTVPAAILVALALGLYKLDGYPLAWSGIKARFRLRPMKGKDWLWTVIAFVVTFLSVGALGPTAQALIEAVPAIAPPGFFPPWLKPGTNFSTDLFAAYVGSPVGGNWEVAILFVVMLFFNIVGEELWWRGYILPRQEQRHGRWTWVIHGLLWWLWHLAFYPWQVFALLPICLALPFVAQRLQNTWAALLIHLQNGVVLLLILAMVLGLA